VKNSKKTKKDVPQTAAASFQQVVLTLETMTREQCLVMLAIVAHRLDELDHVEEANVCAALIASMLHHKEKELYQHVTKFVEVMAVGDYWMGKFKDQEQHDAISTAE
jgi:hypothetical protein